MQKLYKTSAGRLCYYTPGNEPKGAVEVGKEPKPKKKAEAKADDVLSKAKAVKNKSAN